MSNYSTQKILFPGNFGPEGVYPKKVIIKNGYSESGSLTTINNLSFVDHLFFFGGFSDDPDHVNEFVDDEINALYNWSINGGGKLIIAQGGYRVIQSGTILDYDVLGEKWGFQHQYGHPSICVPTTAGSMTTLFNGPFGSVPAASQGGSLQGFLSEIPENSIILATDYEQNPTIILDCNTLDLILPEADVYTDLGGISVGFAINNSQDSFWANTIAFMDQLQGFPHIVHHNGELKLRYTYNSYEWYKDEVMVSTDSKITDLQPGSYQVKISTNGGCELTSNVFQIDCLPLPDIELGADRFICQGEDLKPLTHFDEDIDYLWQDGSSYWSREIAKSGNYWLKVTNNCGTSIDSLYADLMPKLNIGNDTAICKGQSLELMSNIPGTSTWSDGETATSFRVSNTGVYWVDVGNECGIIRDSIVVKVDQPIDLDLGNHKTLCTGEQLVLDVTNDNASYLWTNRNSRDSVPKITVTTTGTFRVRVSNACGSKSDLVVVQFRDPLDIGEDRTLCEGAHLQLSANREFDSYKWQNGAKDDSYLVTGPGHYWLETTDEACGTQRDSVLVQETPNPFGNTDWVSVSCSGEGYVIEASLSDTQYQWEDGSDGSTKVFPSAGSYPLEVFHKNCIFPGAVEVPEGICPPTLKMPNVFTPNSDGINDFFEPSRSENIVSINIEIYNRSGRTIRFLDDSTLRWDGKDQRGNDVPSGTYFYYIRYAGLDNHDQQVKGIVNVLR